MGCLLVSMEQQCRAGAVCVRLISGGTPDWLWWLAWQPPMGEGSGCLRAIGSPSSAAKAAAGHGIQQSQRVGVSTSLACAPLTEVSHFTAQHGHSVILPVGAGMLCPATEGCIWGAPSGA